MRRKICTLISLALFLFLGCAKRGAPPGGPPDVTPPKVIATTPADGDILVPTDATITIQFDEPIRSDAGTVLLYPPIDDIKVIFRKKSVEISHKTPFADGATYTVILTPQFSDRRSNRIGKPFQMAFSTGQAIDTLQVSGYVLDGTLLMTAQDALVAAYSDSMMSQAPLRITFVSPDGGFRISNMPYKTVWLFAGTGMGTQTDWRRATKIAVAAKATPLPATKPITLVLAANDTLPPRILATGAPDSFTARIKFDEFVRLDSLVRGLPKPAKIWRDPGDSLSLLVRDVAPMLGETLALRLCDRFYNCADGQALVPPNAPRDTLPPVLAIKKGKVQILPDEPLEIIATEPFSAVVSVFIGDSAAAFDTAWVAPNALAITLRIKPPPASAISVHLDSICDQFGNCTGDTASFTVSEEKLGEFTMRGFWQCGNQAIFLKNQDGQIFDVHASGAEHKRFIPGGTYTVWRCCDSDGDGAWTPGKLSPFRYAEPLEVFADTIYIRAGWESEIRE